MYEIVVFTVEHLSEEKGVEFTVHVGNEGQITVPR
jgi:hypothetical protein